MIKQKSQPKNWRKVKLGKVAVEIRDLYEPKRNEHLKYIGLEHIEQWTLKLNAVGDSAETQSAKKSFLANDILFGTLRTYFRKVVKPKFSGVCSTDITVLRAKKGYDQNFLYYFIANPFFINFASTSGEGTRMPRAKWKYLANTEWQFPCLLDQKRIADILSAFDDKIELNNKINQTLEQMAQAIFKEWLLKNQKSKIKNQKLGDLIKIISGHPFSSKLYTKNRKALGVVTIKNVQDENFITSCDSFIDKENIPKNMSRECRIHNGDILLSLTGNVGRVCFVYGGEYLLNQRVAKLKPKNERDRVFCYFLFRQAPIQNQLINMAKGSAQPNLSPVETGEIEFSIPSRKILDKFNEFAGSIYSRLVQNAAENQKLAALRDLLLPKLMSGEIRV